MKKSGILNAQLAGCIAALGHKQLFLVGDAGMPIPPGVPVVDLALCCGVPAFRQVLDAILDETVIESYTFAREVETENPEMAVYFRKALAEVPGQAVSHEELKQMERNVKFAVRTGEATPYANLILQAGVAF
jgi:D-ribose pyranase